MYQGSLARAATALPILGFSCWAAYILHRNGVNECVNGFLEEIVLTKKIDFGPINIPILQKFFHVQAIDDALRPVTVAFAPSTLAIDPVSAYQSLTFLTDYGILYAIWLFESTRKASDNTPAKYPFQFFLPAQIVTIGVIGPVYYFLYYMFNPVSNIRSSGNRITNTAYTRGILVTQTIFFYIPLLLSYLHPSLTARHFWNWAWQLFPVFISISLSLIAYLPSSSTNHKISTTKKSSAQNSDLTLIRVTIGTFAIISASVWLYTLYSTPFSLATLFVPYSPTEDSFLPVMRRFFQVDHVASFGASLLWITYLFADLKKAGLVQQNWVVLFLAKSVLLGCFGPGVTLAAGWLWREEVLAGAEISDVFDARKKRK